MVGCVCILGYRVDKLQSSLMRAIELIFVFLLLLFSTLRNFSSCLPRTSCWSVFLFIVWAVLVLRSVG
jgi:hypothetical protein